MKRMFTAFILNLIFAIIEFFGGLYTGSVAILSDSVHDFGDAVSIGMSYFYEKKSRRPADDKFTFGYARYSILSATKVSLILIVGAGIMLLGAIQRLFNPQPINYNGMLIIAIIGFVINLLATFFTRNGDTLNQKAINLHLLEDVLGWAIVLIGAIVMKFTNLTIIDTILSIFTSAFILFQSIRNLYSATELLTEKAPRKIPVQKIKEKILEYDEVIDIHHFRIWALDEHNTYAIMHIVVKDDFPHKNEIRTFLKEFGITNTTIEIEKENNSCDEIEHHFPTERGHHHHHHH